ncbi:hypothetical protein QBC45DRAFT_434614 [Copromyces sp. CBS 386.78]|nr:hypothetical protein QBC45DRAFT_434614 [Copromyces sp. CBS 386.78]
MAPVDLAKWTKNKLRIPISTEREKTVAHVQPLHMVPWKLQTVPNIRKRTIQKQHSRCSPGEPLSSFSQWFLQMWPDLYSREGDGKGYALFLTAPNAAMSGRFSRPWHTGLPFHLGPLTTILVLDGSLEVAEVPNKSGSSPESGVYTTGWGNNVEATLFSFLSPSTSPASATAGREGYEGTDVPYHFGGPSILDLSSFSFSSANDWTTNNPETSETGDKLAVFDDHRFAVGLDCSGGSARRQHRGSSKPLDTAFTRGLKVPVRVRYVQPNVTLNPKDQALRVISSLNAL